MPAGATTCAEAVVLRAVDYGEADRIVTLLTRTHGKVSAMARSARKSQRRFGGALGLFVVGEATLRDGRGGDMFVLERFDARHDYSTLASDVLRMAHASYGTELVRELTEPRHPDPVLFELLCELYAVVAAREPRADTLRAYELRLLDELGLRPVLDRCVSCGADDADALDRPGALIDPVRGGVLCGHCAARAPHDPQRKSLPAEARARLLRVRELTLDDAAALDPAPGPTQTAARNVAHALVAAHLRGPIKSLEFLTKLRQAVTP